MIYQYIKDKVNVRVTDTTIEHMISGELLPARLYGRPPAVFPQYFEHMLPDQHTEISGVERDRFRKWAETIGINTYAKLQKQYPYLRQRSTVLQWLCMAFFEAC